MDKYLLFAGEYYYPGGGWNDLVNSFPTMEAVAVAIDGLFNDIFTDWFHVVDRDTGKIVFISIDLDK